MRLKVVVLLVVLLLLAGCRQSSHYDGETLSVAAYGNVFWEERIREVVEAYGAERGIPVRVEVSPRGLLTQRDVHTAPAAQMGFGYEQRILVQMAAREVPDLIAIPEERFLAYVEQGAFLPITGVSLDLPPERLARYMRDGVLYGIPHPHEELGYGIWYLTQRPQGALDLAEYLAGNLDFSDLPWGYEVLETTNGS